VFVDERRRDHDRKIASLLAHISSWWRLPNDRLRTENGADWFVSLLKIPPGPGHDVLASPGNFKARLCCRFAAEAATDDHRHNFKLRFAASKAVRPP
jgi:hypothetical protein